MDDDNVTPLSVDDNDAPFGGPDPDADDLVSTEPGTDSDIDEQELYDEGLAGAAGLDQDDIDDSEDADLPDGFHIE